MIIYKAYKFRMDPTLEQKRLINQNLGSVRFIYNHFLEEKIKTYETYKKVVSPYMQMKSLRKLKDEYPWLKEVDHCSLMTTIFNLDDTFKSMIKEGKYPNYKSKYNKESYTTNNELKTWGNIKYYSVRLNLKDRIVILPRLKSVTIRGYKKLSSINGKIKSATVSKVANKFYVSLLVEMSIEVPENKCEKILGIDLGIKNYIVTSDGKKYKNEININEQRLKGLHRALSRSTKGSRNREKVIIKIQKFYRSLKNKRKTQICEIVKRILQENDVVVTEDLDVKKMYQTKSIAVKLRDVPFTNFIETMSYKAKWQGKKVIKIDRYFPSSQVCSDCGYQNKTLKDLSVREWICPKCNAHHDRDKNASINIKNEGIKILLKQLNLY